LRAHVDMMNEDAVVQCVEKVDIKLAHEPGQALKVYLDGEDVTEAIRDATVTVNAKHVARIKRVRDIMTALQIAFAEGQDIVTEGRDQGSVVFPNAQAKFYLDADISERVRRRSRELRDRGYAPTEDNVKQEILVRDRSDRERTAGPLTQSTDMFYLDTTRMRLGEAVALMEAFVSKRRGS